MSPDQLRSIFHVEDVDLVPNYELVQLQHHAPESPEQHHHLRKRAIWTNTLSDGGGPQLLYDALGKQEPNHEGVRHRKKDLSKNAYFSASKSAVNSDKPSANKFNTVADQFSGPQAPPSDDGEVLGASGGSLRDDVVDVNVDGETGRLDAPLPRHHNVSLTAFGERLHLKLTPTEGLFKNGGPHTLRMWTVKPNPNASQGLDYEEVIEVSYLATNDRRNEEFSASPLHLT